MFIFVAKLEDYEAPATGKSFCLESFMYRRTINYDSK